MRFVVFVVLCLVGGLASSFAQSGSQSNSTPGEASAAPLTTEPVSQPAEEQAAKPAAQPAVQPVEQAAQPAEQPSLQSVEQAPKPAEQPAAQHIEQAAKPAAQPAQQSIEQAAKPAEKPAAEPVEQAAKPAEQPAPQQAAKPVEQPSKQLAAKPTDQSVEQTADQPGAKKIAEAAKPTCPGHPDALGTSRVLTISPSEYQLLGTIQYKHTLPLKDHEVVLTFDDGPIPPYTNSILNTLAANCVKATYFLVGEMVHARPYLVRRIYNEGHSIGTHTQHHPFAMQRLSMQRVEREVDDGIASADAALGDPRAVSPFFRIPGLGRTNAIEHFLEHKGLVTWSADIDTNDWWRGTTPGALIQRTMRRLNAKGRGIVLMHDIHPATALALPALLKRLKAEGYRVVHVVAAGERPKTLPEVVATPAEKAVWPAVLHAKTEKSGAAVSTLRLRVKTEITKRHSHRRTGHTASANARVTSTAMNERHKF
jgi:peptidoglycan/xylan/chitin deacetylase (PgdA/CDA1 family)